MHKCMNGFRIVLDVFRVLVDAEYCLCLTVRFYRLSQLDWQLQYRLLSTGLITGEDFHHCSYDYEKSIKVDFFYHAGLHAYGSGMRKIMHHH